MRHMDMVSICCRCKHYRAIDYCDGTRGIGCVAHDVNCPYPVNIKYIERCPLGKDERK